MLNFIVYDPSKPAIPDTFELVLLEIINNLGDPISGIKCHDIDSEKNLLRILIFVLPLANFSIL